ncbi:hypothetical protein Tco_0157012 [Tanacetum coccineum]
MAELLLEEKLHQALQALCEMLDKNVQEKQEEKNVAEEQAAKVSSQYWKPPIYYDDDDEECSIPLRDINSELPLSVAIAPDLPITNSLIMEDEHLNTIPDWNGTKKMKNNRANSIFFLIEEFVGKLAPIDLILPRIVEADFDPKEDIRLIENLLNDNSSPHTPEELNSEIPDDTIESFFFPISFPASRNSDSLWRRDAIYFLLRMTRYHRVLRMTTMT